MFHTSFAINIGGSIKRDYPCSSFITKMSIVNVVGASFKTEEQLNHIGTLQWVGDTCWSSYLRSVSRWIKMFTATCEALLNIID